MPDIELFQLLSRVLSSLNLTIFHAKAGTKTLLQTSTQKTKLHKAKRKLHTKTRMNMLL